MPYSPMPSALGLSFHSSGLSGRAGASLSLPPCPERCRSGFEVFRPWSAARTQSRARLPGAPRPGGLRTGLTRLFPRFRPARTSRRGGSFGPPTVLFRQPTWHPAATARLVVTHLRLRHPALVSANIEQIRPVRLSQDFATDKADIASGNGPSLSSGRCRGSAQGGN